MTVVACGDNVVIPLLVSTYRVDLHVPEPHAEQVRDAFADVILSDGSHRRAGRSGSRVHRVEVRVTADRFVITVDGQLWDPGPDQSLCDQLVYVLMRASLDAERHLLHLHGGYVALDGDGVFIAGYPMSGKSTLTVRLVEDGFDYLTDERIALDRRLALTPMSKPVSLVAVGSGPLAHLDPSRTGRGVASPKLWHVPATSLRAGSVVPAESVTPRLVVFLERTDDSGSDVGVVEAHPAEMARLLLSDAPDAVRMGARGVEIAARFCASLRCVRLVCSHPEIPVPLIREELERARCHVANDVTVFPAANRPQRRRGGAPDEIRPLSAARGVGGAIVGGRAVLHRSLHGDLVELDEVSTVWALLFDGGGSFEELVAEVAEENEMQPGDVMPIAREAAERLVSLGVLA